MNRLYNHYFNNREVLDFFHKHHILIDAAEMIKGTELSEPSFCVTSGGTRYFVKFSNINRFTPEFISSLQDLNSNIGNVIQTPIVSENLQKTGKQINIYNWIEGCDLRTILQESSDENYYRYGVLCGKLMRKIHCRVFKGENCFDIISKFAQYFERIQRSGFTFINAFDYQKYFYDQSNLLLRGVDGYFIHLDFKPKNLMLCKNKIIVVDIDSSLVGDPWLDFYDKAFPLQRKKEIYTKMLINSYFDGNIPDCFWGYFKILSIFALVQNTAWLLHRKDGKYLRDIESYLWNSYKGFEEVVPTWFG